MWHNLINVRQSADQTISAQVDIDGESTWFSGHFPGDPILPGVAQLGIVAETIERALCRPMNVKGISRVRFRRIIRPGETIQLSITPTNQKSGTYSFRITAGPETVCSGFVDVEDADEG